MPTCCAVGCSSSIAKGDKLFVVPRGKNNEERRAVWLHRIGRKNFDCHRGRLCEVSTHYRTSSRRHASGRLSDKAHPWFRFMLNKSSLKFPSTLSRTISTTMTARSFLACSNIRIRPQHNYCWMFGVRDLLSKWNHLQRKQLCFSRDQPRLWSFFLFFSLELWLPVGKISAFIVLLWFIVFSVCILSYLSHFCALPWPNFVHACTANIRECMVNIMLYSCLFVKCIDTFVQISNILAKLYTFD